MQTPHYIDVHGLSVQGDEHANNHDHFAIATLNKSMRVHQSNLTIDDESRMHGHNQGQLLLVADGISALPAPERASGTAIDSVVQYFLNEMPWYHLADGSPDDAKVALKDALRNAQEELRRSASPDQKGLGTTLTLAFVFWPHLFIAHVGDSRCYLSRGTELRQLTTDHTVAEVRRSVGGASTGHDQNILWNALGGRDASLTTEVRHVRLQPGDRLALVTDGVTKEKSDEELRAFLQGSLDAENACGRLVLGSGSDDRTAIVVRFPPTEETTSKSVPTRGPRPLAAARALPEPRKPMTEPKIIPRRRIAQ